MQPPVTTGLGQPAQARRDAVAADTDKVFSGSIPELYDRLLVPLIFRPYALDLAKRVVQSAPGSVLETATGTGALTREISSRLPARARIMATDLNQPMLNYAKEKQGKDTRIAWRQADALNLPFENDRFDVVTCQFGAMFFPDKVQGYREARRVLKSGGRFIFNVWDRISENEFAEVVTDALANFFPSDPPRFLARTPHGYNDVERIRSELAAAGFTTISVDAVEERSKALSPRDPAVAYCQGTPLSNEILARTASGMAEATECAAAALARRFGNGPIEGRIRAFVFAAA